MGLQTDQYISSAALTEEVQTSQNLHTGGPVIKRNIHCDPVLHYYINLR